MGARFIDRTGCVRARAHDPQGRRAAPAARATVVDWSLATCVSQVSSHRASTAPDGCARARTASSGPCSIRRVGDTVPFREQPDTDRRCLVESGPDSEAQSTGHRGGCCLRGFPSRFMGSSPILAVPPPREPRPSCPPPPPARPRSRSPVHGSFQTPRRVNSSAVSPGI
jgi:hypothetical protein